LESRTGKISHGRARMTRMEYEEISKKIIGAFYEVYRTLGVGFLEKVYGNALAVEFERLGLSFRSQYPIKVCYKDEIVGDYFADFIVDDKIVVEIKAKEKLCSIDEAQLLNYLKATGKKVGLLFNFGGDKPEFKRRIF